MKRIGFIGAYDKIDLIIYVGKILATLGKRVLVIDATLNQKARYVVPVINPSKTYITEYEGIDIAVGFSNYEDINRYLGVAENVELEYDCIFVDTDNYKGLENYKLNESFKNYFVTSFDAYSLKKGLEILSVLKTPLSLTKILFSKEMLKEEDDYLNFLSLGYKIIWSEYKIYFPIENGDLSVIYENKKKKKIRFKKLSVEFKDQLEYICEEILGDVSGATIRRTIKNIEKII